MRRRPGDRCIGSPPELASSRPMPGIYQSAWLRQPPGEVGAAVRLVHPLGATDPAGVVLTRLIAGQEIRGEECSDKRLRDWARRV